MDSIEPQKQLLGLERKVFPENEEFVLAYEATFDDGLGI